VLLPDHGRGYLDRFYDDDWMTGHGFAALPAPPTAHALAEPTPSSRDEDVHSPGAHAVDSLPRNDRSAANDRTSEGIRA
jgi:hypothetical protein